MYLFAPCFIRRIWRREMECTLVQALRLCTGRTAHRGSRGIALPFHDHGNRRGWGVSVTPRPFFPPGKDPVPIVQEAGWAPGPVWTGAENLAPSGILSPDCPARSQSLYRLSYPGPHQYLHTWWNIQMKTPCVPADPLKYIAKFAALQIWRYIIHYRNVFMFEPSVPP